MLRQMLGAYFGREMFYEFETLTEAVDASVAGFDLVGQKQIATEWWDWVVTVGATEEVRAHLDSYGVELDFNSEAEARKFTKQVYDALIIAIRRQENGWKR